MTADAASRPASGTVTSHDGTTVAYDARGLGRPLIFVDGATAYRSGETTNDEIADLLADEFRVYCYDRRGRGESSDTAPYAIEREIEDLASLIDVAGGEALVFGWSSGAVLGLDAAAADLPISGLLAFEPPFVVDDSRPPLPPDYVEQVEAAVTDGRPGDAVALFMTAAAGISDEFVDSMRHEPIWPGLEAIAHTIAYDGRIMGTTMSGNPLPDDRWSDLAVPTLVVHGTGTFPFLVPAAQDLADLLPTATLKPVPGENHSAPADVLADTIRRFAAAVRTERPPERSREDSWQRSR